MKFPPILLCVLFCACQPAFDYVEIGGDGEYGPEKAFLESLFEEGGGFKALGLGLLPDEADPGSKTPQPTLFIELFSSWEFEGAFGDILISREVLVPREDALAGRTATTLAACREGRESLIPPGELEPPFTALRVDGLTVGDQGYPLIRATGIRVRGEEGRKTPDRVREKLRLLGEALEAAPKPLAAPQPELTWIVAGGDLMLDRGASEILLREGPAGIFGGTAEMLAQADLTLVNLEGVVSRRGEKVQKSFNFRFVPEISPALRDAGIDAVLHANNHVYDYGEVAFLDSLSWLAQAGLGVVGAGIDDETASEPFVFKQGETAYRVFGLASFPRERNGWDGVSAAAGPGRAGMLHAGKGGGEKLKAKLGSGDALSLNILLFHGGIEWSTQPDTATRKLYTDLIAAGADLVIGSHPHVVQGFEWVMGKPVFWSLGNYVFGGMDNTEGGEEGLFIRLGYWGGRLLYLEPFALTLTHTRTNIAPPEKLELFYARSRKLREQHPLP